MDNLEAKGYISDCYHEPLSKRKQNTILDQYSFEFTTAFQQPLDTSNPFRPPQADNRPI